MNFAASSIVHVNAPSTACPIDENTPPTSSPTASSGSPPPIGCGVAAAAGGEQQPRTDRHGGDRGERDVILRQRIASLPNSTRPVYARTAGITIRISMIPPITRNR